MTMHGVDVVGLQQMNIWSEVGGWGEGGDAHGYLYMKQIISSSTSITNTQPQSETRPHSTNDTINWLTHLRV